MLALTLFLGLCLFLSLSLDRGSRRTYFCVSVCVCDKKETACLYECVCAAGVGVCDCTCLCTVFLCVLDPPCDHCWGSLVQRGSYRPLFARVFPVREIYHLLSFLFYLCVCISSQRPPSSKCFGLLQKTGTRGTRLCGADRPAPLTGA